jgi:hypothetical protein
MVTPRCPTAEQREAFFFLPAEPPAWCIEMAKWPYHGASGGCESQAFVARVQPYDEWH